MGSWNVAEAKKAKKRQAVKTAAFMEAKRIAGVLVKKFGAQKVILYGSLVKDKVFDAASDIDLAVMGLGKDYYRAYGFCIRAAKFRLDIHSYEDMPPRFKEKVDAEGRSLYEKK